MSDIDENDLLDDEIVDDPDLEEPGTGEPEEPQNPDPEEENPLMVMLYTQIGDADRANPNITDKEYEMILRNAASEYSRIKSYTKFYEVDYTNEENVYILPEDCYKVKDAKFKNSRFNIEYIDNTDQIIIVNEPDVTSDVLKVTYSKYFKPEEVIEREIDLYLLYAEALCYKLLASKTAELIKFSTGEKTVDESNISEKYNALYKSTEAKFRSKAIKAYGKRADYKKDNFNYHLPYPPEGELP